MTKCLRHSALFLLALASLFLVRVNAEVHQIHVVIEESEAQIKNEDNYYLSVLNFLLHKSKQEFGDYEINVCRNYLTQERQFMYLRTPGNFQSAECKIDLLWSSPAKGRNEGVHALNIPVDLGLNGIRTLVVLNDSLSKFERINDQHTLSNMIACQGSHWPDTRILKSSGLQVLGTVTLDSMYAMLKRGRCDYLPTAIHEVKSELAHYSAGELEIVKHLVLRYDLPTYFYVRKGDAKLSKRLSETFTKTVQDGSFYAFVKTHKVTKNAFSIAFSKDLTILDLENSELLDPLYAPSVSLERISQLLFEDDKSTLH